MSCLLTCFGKKNSKTPETPPPQMVESRPAAAERVVEDLTSSGDRIDVSPESTDIGGQSDIDHDAAVAVAALEHIHEPFLVRHADAVLKDPTILGRSRSFSLVEKK